MSAKDYQWKPLGADYECPICGLHAAVVFACGAPKDEDTVRCEVCGNEGMLRVPEPHVEWEDDR